MNTPPYELEEEMRELADGVWRLSERLGPMINVYLVGDVLIDAGRRQDRGRIFDQIQGRQLSMLALTHAHADHQGSAHAVCEARRVPLACHADDVDAMEGRRSISGTSTIGRLITRWWAGPPHPVDRVLVDGDEVAGFRVVHAPGHSPGEVIFFRESDGVAICGDVIRSISYATARAKLLEPPDAFNDDSRQNRDSIRRLARLRPSLILPGHGDAVRDMRAFDRFVAALPGDGPRRGDGDGAPPDGHPRSEEPASAAR
jgi:glyoxylase-like metal-dependent hydrolase (beta-lactamase superfamily II)